MASNSDRRSASSGASDRRKSVYISGDQTRQVRDATDEQPAVSGRSKASRRRSGQPPALGRGRAPHSGGPHTDPKTKPATPSADQAPAVPRGPLLRGQARQRSKEADEFSAGKRDERQQRQQSREFRNRALAIGAVALVAIGLIGWIALYRSQAFEVRNVTVIGNSRVPTARVLELAGVPPKTTLLRAPIEQVVAGLAADPWIASATVERVWPDTLKIVVAERVPLAAVELPDKSQWLVDGSGTFIAPRSALPKAVIPVVRDVASLPASATAGLDTHNPQLANAVAVLAGLGPDLRGVVRYVNARTVDETAVFTDTGLEILFGAARQMDKKDFLARRILADQKGKVVFIDVRTVERPVWRGLGK
jgi:cell division protein FtsQ